MNRRTLGEAIAPAMILGCGLVLLGTALANESFQKRQL